LHLTKSGGGAQKHGEPWTLKSGGLKPRSLTEVYAYDCSLIQMTQLRSFVVFVQSTHTYTALKMFATSVGVTVTDGSKKH